MEIIIVRIIGILLYERSRNIMVLVINISHQDQRDDRCVKYQSINYKINKHLFDKSIGYLNVRFPTNSL